MKKSNLDRANIHKRQRWEGLNVRHGRAEIKEMLYLKKIEEGNYNRTVNTR
jgi:hypothetical protein